MNKKEEKKLVSSSSPVGKWFKKTFAFFMESVFMWPEKVCKELFDDWDAEESEEDEKKRKREEEKENHWEDDFDTADDDDDSSWEGNLGKGFSFSTKHQIKEGEEIQKPKYYEGKDSHENVFRRKMKNKEGKLIQLIKSISIGAHVEEPTILEKGSVLLYLGLCGLEKKKVDDEYLVFIGQPTWLWGEKKLYGWIPVHHFSIVGEPKKDFSQLREKYNDKRRGKSKNKQ